MKLNNVDLDLLSIDDLKKLGLKYNHKVKRILLIEIRF